MDGLNLVGVAFGLSLSIERMTEFLLNLLFTLIKDFGPVWYEKMSGGIKMMLTFLFNFTLYIVLIRWNFALVFFQELGIPMMPWQGLIFSALVIAGGSQYAHQFFGFFGKKPPEDVG
jgi:hypothetical protein